MIKRVDVLEETNRILTSNRNIEMKYKEERVEIDKARHAEIKRLRDDNLELTAEVEKLEFELNRQEDEIDNKDKMIEGQLRLLGEQRDTIAGHKATIESSSKIIRAQDVELCRLKCLPKVDDWMHHLREYIRAGNCPWCYVKMNGTHAHDCPIRKLNDDLKFACETNANLTQQLATIKADNDRLLEIRKLMRSLDGK